VGGRRELLELLAHLEGPDGSRPQAVFPDPVDARALSFQLEGARAADGSPVAQVVRPGLISAPCHVRLSRDPDLVWVVVREGTCRTRQIQPPEPGPEPEPAPEPWASWIEGSAGVYVGNRGAGPGLSFAGGAGQHGPVDLELGGRIWAHSAIAPEQRLASGVDVLVRAGDGGFVELGLGVAGWVERIDGVDTCTRAICGPRLGTSFTGAVGLRGPLASGGQTDLLGVVRARSLPDRRYAIGLEVGLVR